MACNPIRTPCQVPGCHNWAVWRTATSRRGCHAWNNHRTTSEWETRRQGDRGGNPRFCLPTRFFGQEEMDGR